MSWKSMRSRFLFVEVNERNFDLPLASVTKDGGVEFRADLNISVWNPGDDTSGYKRVKPGDFVIGLRSFQSGIGASELEGLVSPAYTVLRPTSDLVDQGYFRYLFKSDRYVSRLENVAQGIRQGRTISTEDFYNIEVLVPPLGEQRAIADYLDTETARIDALITKKRRLITLLEERWVVHRQKVLLGTLDPVSGIGSAPSGSWDVLNLGVLIELQRGHDLPADQRRPGSVPIISSGGPSGFHEIAAVPGPGVVTGRYGTIGEVFYVVVDYWPLNTTLFVKDFRENDPRWVYHLLAAIPLDAEKDKSAVTGINRNVVGQLRVPRPSAAEQRRLSELLDEANQAKSKLVARVQCQLDLLAEHRQALITAAVTGELRVPGVAA